MLKVGLLVGREWSFPPAFIEEVARRDEGVVAEFITLGGTGRVVKCDMNVAGQVPAYDA